MDRMKLLEELEDGKSCCLNMFQGGGAEITRDGPRYDVYEIQQYGGEPKYEATFYKDEFRYLLNLIDTWT